jgi:tetratricopeptide (TPR) repeat protein
MSREPIPAFLSCSLRNQDKQFVDTIIDLAKSYGFETGGTPGKYTQSPSNLLEYIKEEIGKYDCLIMAATPRYIQEDIHDKNIKKESISEILHVESTIAYCNDKPLLIFAQPGTNIPYFLESFTQPIVLPADYRTDKELMHRIENYFENARGIIKLNHQREKSVERPSVKPRRFPRETEFIGNVHAVYSIKKEIEDGRSVCIFGIGGIGKTAGAYKSIHFVEQQFTNIIPIYLNTNSNLSDFVLPFLGLYHHDNIVPEELSNDLDKIKRRLASYSRNLIFIDNFEFVYSSKFSDNLTTVISFLQDLPGNTQVLLTSRKEVDIEQIKNIPFPGLNREDGLTLFRRNAGNKIPKTISSSLEEDITKVVNSTGGHPLALKILGRNFGGKFHFEDISESDFLALPNKNEPVERFTTIPKCFDYSFLLLDRRLRKYLSKLVVFKFPFTEDAAQKILRISQSDFNKIYQSGFLERIDISERGLPLDILFYDFHPLVRDFLVKRRREDHSYEAELVKYYLDLIDRAGNYDPFAREVFNSIITSYYMRRDLFRKVIDFHQNVYNRSKVTGKIGLLIGNLGFIDESRAYHLECLEMDKELQDDKWIVDDLRNIGLSYRRSNKDLAIKYCKEALEKGEAIHHVEPMQYNELGQLFLAKKQYEDAFKYLDKGYRFALVRRNLDLVYCINSVSMYHYLRMNYLKCFGFCKMALTYLENMKDTLSKEKYEDGLSIVLPNMSLVCKRLGKLDESIKYQSDVIDLHKKYHNVHGLLVDYHNLSNYYYDVGMLEEGMKYYEKYAQLKGDLDHGVPVDSSRIRFVDF